MSRLQGEFVSTSRLEATYAGNSDLIHQMYIYGSGLRSYLLAAVVPSERELCLSCHIKAHAVHLQHGSLHALLSPILLAGKATNGGLI